MLACKAGRGRFNRVGMPVSALVVIDSARTVRDDGTDRFARAKWRLGGQTTDGLDLEIVCALDRDEQGNLVVFITAYWV